MIGDSKILTVSYGTFSCTLEGFDDPFSTMKSIAEYFRDLAADDRYFGAEPPTPDAAMLHRIAEREVSRMVEARVQDNSVILRQHDGSVALPQALASATAAHDAPQPTEARAPEPQPVPVPPMAPADTSFTGAAANPFASAPEEEPEAPALQDEIPDGVAAKLARIRQSVSYRPAAAPLADEDFAAPADEVEPPLTTAFLADEYEGEMDVAPLPTETDALPEDFAAGDVGPVEAAASTEIDDVLARLGQLLGTPQQAEQPVTEASVEAVDVIVEAPELPVTLADNGNTTLADSIAAAMGTEQSPVATLLLSETVAEHAALSDDFTEDFADDTDDRDDIDDALVATVTEAQPYLLRASAEDQSAEATDEETLVQSDDLAATLETAPEPEFHDEDEDRITVTEALVGEGQAVPALLLETIAATPEADHAPVAEDAGLASVDLSPDLADAIDTIAATDTPVSQEEDASDTDINDGVLPKRAHARVIRIRRADDASSEDDPEPSDDPTRRLDALGEDAAMSRLMRQADDEMQGTENRRRLSAIAHLKAAVAATEAERAVTGEAISTPGAKIGDYRDDLAHAVQPLDPEPPAPVRPRRETVSERPKGPRPGSIHPGMLNTPPPLMLVSEQRIDRTPPTGQPMVAVRPGRLTGAIGASAASLASSVDQMSASVSEFDEDEDADDADNIFTDDAGFAEFAAKLGVKSVPDLLEAAAAYATCIENRAHFTRPQLMRRLTAATNGKPVSREDGLRSFGTLLRTGRIEKVSRGQYALADTSAYLVEARRMAL